MLNQNNEPNSGRHPLKDDAFEVLKNFLIVLCAIVFLVIVAFVVWSLVRAIGYQADRFFCHLAYLFQEAPYFLRTSKGFGAFIQLVLIAVFVGWATKRLLRRK